MSMSWIRKNSRFSLSTLSKNSLIFIKNFHDFVVVFKFSLMSVRNLITITKNLNRKRLFLVPATSITSVHTFYSERQFGVCWMPADVPIKCPSDVFKDGQNSLHFVRLADIIWTSRANIHLYQVDF